MEGQGVMKGWVLRRGRGAGGVCAGNPLPAPFTTRDTGRLSIEGGGGIAIRNFSQSLAFSLFFLQFSAIFRMFVGALCVPCAAVLLHEALEALVTAPQFFRNFSQFDLTLPDRNPSEACA